MSKSTISTFQLFEMFPDAEAARVYMEGKRWPDGAVCPACDEAKRITTRKGGFYRCNACKTDFTVRTATIFERSHIPLNAWIVAFGIVTQSPEVSSAALAHDLGVTQKTGWLMLERIREAAGDYLVAAINSEPGFLTLTAWPAYRVGEDGSLWSRYRPGRGGRLGMSWRRMSPTIDKDGYRVARLYAAGGAWKQLRVSRLVCEAFYGPCPAGQECRHLDGQESNDAAINLAWGTPVENHADKWTHGTARHGETHHNATLTDSQIAEIRSLKGRMLQREIADKFGITQGYVSELHAANGKRLTYKALIA